MSVGRRRLFALLVAVVAGVLVWLIALPNLGLLFGSVVDSSGGGWRLSLEGYRRFFLGDGLVVAGRTLPNIELQALRNSLDIALRSVLVSALIGVPLALLFWRYEFPGRRIVAALATVPVLLPPLVGVIAFYFLYGEGGAVTRAAMRLLDTDQPPWSFTGIPAVIVVHAYSMYVYFYVFVSAGLERLDDSQLEAAAMLGAGRGRVVRTVLLPLLTPALVGASLLVFMMSMASFTAPYVIGGVKVLTTQMLISRQFERFQLMRAETVVLAVVCLAFLGLLRWVEGRGSYVGGVKGAGRTRRPVARGWQRWLLGAVGAATVLVLLLPHLMLLLMSFADDKSWTDQLLPPVYTTANYAWIATDRGGQEPVINSLAMALQATAANVVFAVLAAWLLARWRFRGRSLLESLGMLPWAIPGTVTALGLAEFFSRHRPWLGQLVLTNTYVILPLAYFVRHTPLVLRAVQSSFAQLDATLEEAAATLGSPPGRVLRTVVLPLIRPGVLAGGVLALISALGEYVASVVLYSTSNRPMAIELWNQIRGVYFGRAAAYGMILIALTGLLLAVAPMAGRREPEEMVA